MAHVARPCKLPGTLLFDWQLSVNRRGLMVVDLRRFAIRETVQFLCRPGGIRRSHDEL